MDLFFCFGDNQWETVEHTEEEEVDSEVAVVLEAEEEEVDLEVCVFSSVMQLAHCNPVVLY